ncbi:hypothetical protein [Pseudomonas sp. GV071]|uniref:hypothetical protein n=1 Tax=Pseudomonas sp. GV071 TaxID=2135754 RepID=UPI000D388376|nr:hypothetical protein [Pseudomonas sp. GV071]PTQ69138.1 acyl carrier protein [Pseudomonas sp. GV071]
MNVRKLFTTALLGMPLMALAVDNNLPLAEAKKVAAQSVLSQTAEILGISQSQVALDTSFANQPSPADELDLVEIIMAIESDIGVSIDDAALSQLAGTTDPDELLSRLTVRTLQDYVGTLPVPSTPPSPAAAQPKPANAPLAIGDAGAYGALAARPNPAGYVIVTVPDISELIPLIEQHEGRQLTADEAKEAHATAPSLVMTRDDAEEFKRRREHSDER